METEQEPPIPEEVARAAREAARRAARGKVRAAGRRWGLLVRPAQGVPGYVTRASLHAEELATTLDLRDAWWTPERPLAEHEARVANARLGRSAVRVVELPRGS